jgi:hypothetical protein
MVRRMSQSGPPADPRPAPDRPFGRHLQDHRLNASSRPSAVGGERLLSGNETVNLLHYCDPNSLTLFPSANEVESGVRCFNLWRRIPLGVMRRVNSVDGTIDVMKLRRFFMHHSLNAIV